MNGKQRIAELIEELNSRTDMPLFDDEKEGRLGHGMAQTIGYQSVFAGAKGIRILTGAGIPRKFISTRENWNGGGNYPTRSAHAKIEFPHHTSRDSQYCLCGCMEIGREIVQNLTDMGIKAQMGGRTQWNDR